ncbi:hypothetical protein N1031_19950 [Herbiconiux moechotypicola]|uniref:DUF4386 family protein n=1 Tax=Herbiconiux moechotypicola TaxID=637393 RepID=A0ABN3E7U8_9MICO|nr:hypothetical protein [Herbiconiux moechotypicola]MCS5732034.1 hypothetical protein [Herbiconiux moechotypicola]
MTSLPESPSAAPEGAAPTAALSADAPLVRRSGFQFTVWPLWAVLAGVAGAVATVGTDLRPPAELAAWEAGAEYTVTPADMLELDPFLGRIGHVAGLVAIIGLLVFLSAWRRRVERPFARSTAARVVSAGLLATAGAALLGYGWRGALANYLGPEAGLYGEDGLFVYYMLTDFGAYLPWFGALVSALALAWMAFVERSVSRLLGTVSGVMAIGLLVGVVATGVPGLPGVLMPVWLAVTGLWLTLGRSLVTDAEITR